MKRTLRILSSLLVLLAGSVAHARDLPNHDASFAAVNPLASSALSRDVHFNRRAPLAHVVARDPRTNAPSLVWGARDAQAAPSSGSLAEAARAHLLALGDLYGLSDAAVMSAKVVQVHDTGRGGVLVVFRQDIGGVPLYHNDAKVLVRRDGSLVAVGGGLSPLAASAPKTAKKHILPAEGAVARALSDLYSMTVPSSVIAGKPEVPAGKPGGAQHGSEGRWVHFDLQSPKLGGLSTIRFESPARARKVYFPMPDRLAPAYYVELFSTEEGEADDMYGYVIAADDGSVLKRQNLTAHAEFKYRVWADSSGDHRPMDGPIADFTPHPAGVPDGSYPDFVAPSLISIDGFNKFADPWLASGDTESRGNNVDAYTDHDDSNSVSGGDVRALTTAPGEFDHVYDTAIGPLASEDQQMAAVTQLFYDINWLHDYWYDSGFDEVAGNAQQDNYGRGGLGGDRLRAEAQDAYDKGAKNNANMGTPEDGVPPRMQMYVWDGREDRSLKVNGAVDSVATGAAEFGPQSFDLTGTVVLADDGTGTLTDACEPLTNDVTGQIVLVDRGQCTFHEKAVNVAAKGAIGMILANNQAGSPPYMPASNFPAVTIPVLSITQADGADLMAAIAAGTADVAMMREEGIDADGTIDNLIVAHEWGHYLHHRLVSCALNQCGAESEGWGDFLALTLQLRETDNLDGTFSDALYATGAFDDAAYFGTRRMPYTTDMTKNPLTFKHIQTSATLPTGVPMVEVFPNNAESHNAGEVWCSMMFEGFATLLKNSQGATPKHTFDEARRRMADYVVLGMKLAPSEPTFTEQRDAIIAAAYASDPEDALAIAEGFAKRGAGSCAVSPPKDSFDNEGVVESFEVTPAVVIASVTLDDSTKSCDNDGLLDANETGKVTVALENASFLVATDTKVKLSSQTTGVTFPNGAEATLTSLDGFGQGTLEFDIEIDPKQKTPSIIDLTVTAENAESCNKTVVRKEVPRVHYDNLGQASAKDQFESDIDVWERVGDLSSVIWTKEADSTGNRVWHGTDFASLSETALLSPPIEVSDSESLVVTFRHRYKFEASNENPGDPSTPFVYWDGGVIEISANGGATWEDVSQYVDPGYVGQISNLADNPLANRMAYSDESPSWPAFGEVSLDFGLAFAGQTVMIRFHIGTDQAAGDHGWDIDDVAFKGITGTPFPEVVPDAQTCSPKVDQAPIADAGPDQTVRGGDTVTVDAGASSDPDGDPLSFSWTQVGGPAVTLSQEGSKATFVAPSLTTEAEVVLAVKVTANGQSNEDTVSIKVLVNTDELSVSGGACGCSMPGDDPSPLAPWGAASALLAGLFAYRRRNTRK